MSSSSPSPFAQKWLAAANLQDIKPDETYQQSANRLRELIKTGLLRYSDARDDPAKFFEAHRLLVDSTRGPGFAIRFTVQFNLFAGTVLGLGSPQQAKILDTMQERGELGCFALTEKLAGVNSGLSVETTCTWDQHKQCFILRTPTTGSEKNWISSGLTADRACVIANLIVEGKPMGPHGFLMNFRENGKVVKGVVLGDMGRKTTGNDLDNAWIRFDNVELPPSALLSRFAQIDLQTGKYIQTTKERMRIEVIGQRLLTGRVAIAQAALQFARKLHEHTQVYCKEKMCWVPGGKVPLISVPHVGALFVEANQTLTKLDKFVHEVEMRLNEVLRKDQIPSPELVEAIAVAKIASAEESIRLCHKLKQEVGSYALMDGTGFQHLDFLVCCKFAEGDSRILMQKIARESFRKFVALQKKGSNNTTDVTMDKKESQLCQKIASVISSGNKNGWDASYRDVYALAGAIMERTMVEWSGEKLVFGGNL